jgi:hypothetical protein
MTIRNSYTYDNLLLLKDAGAVTADGAAQVSSAARQIDVGPARFDGIVVIDTSALDFTTTDETYQVIVQGSNTAGMGSGVINLASATVTTALARNELLFSNQQGSTQYRYLRAYIDVGGTTPSINATAFIAKR